MPYTVGFDEALEIVEVVFDGRNTARDLEESTRRAVELGQEQGTHLFLADTEALEPSLPLVAVYDLPNHQYGQLQLDRKSRIAVVQSHSNRALEVVKFFETACLNSGWQAKVFATRQEALDWLALCRETC